MTALKTVLSSFLLIAASEMGDKTQLLAFALATRFKKPGPIMVGILTATLLNHGIASWAGVWISTHVSPTILRVALGVVFVTFGLWILIPDKDGGADKPQRFGPYASTTISFFFAEMGDKTQLATVALGARFHSFGWVTLGTTLGMLVSDGAAVALGATFADKIPMRAVRWGASILFILFGVGILVREGS